MEKVHSEYSNYESESEVTQLCLTLWYPMDCSLPGFSIHGIFQARVLKWVAISFSRGSSRPRDRTWVSHIAGRFFTVWATRKSQVCWEFWFQMGVRVCPVLLLIMDLIIWFFFFSLLMWWIVLLDFHLAAGLVVAISPVTTSAAAALLPPSLLCHLLHGPVYPLLGAQMDGSLRCPGMLGRSIFSPSVLEIWWVVNQRGEKKRTALTIMMLMSLL